MDPVLLGYPESADKVTCSPDQRYGVFSQKDGEDWTLSIMEVATGEIRLLSEGNSPFSRPKWSPDGGSLAFTAGGDLDALFISDVARRSTHMLISGVVLHDFFWLPDGDRLLYMLGGVQKGVYLVKAHPPGVKKLIVGHSPSHFLVSPSGQKLVGWNCCPWVGRDLDLIVIDLKDENAVVLISDSLIKSLDDQAYDHCAPEDCRW
jgi:WD40 repeat protein